MTVLYRLHTNKIQIIGIINDCKLYKVGLEYIFIFYCCSLVIFKTIKCTPVVNYCRCYNQGQDLYALVFLFCNVSLLFLFEMSTNYITMKQIIAYFNRKQLNCMFRGLFQPRWLVKEKKRKLTIRKKKKYPSITLLQQVSIVEIKEQLLERSNKYSKTF